MNKVNRLNRIEDKLNSPLSGQRCRREEIEKLIAGKLAEEFTWEELETVITFYLDEDGIPHSTPLSNDDLDRFTLANKPKHPDLHSEESYDD